MQNNINQDNILKNCAMKNSHVGGVWANFMNNINEKIEFELRISEKIEFELKIWLFGKTHMDAPLKKLEKQHFELFFKGNVVKVKNKTSILRFVPKKF